MTDIICVHKWGAEIGVDLPMRHCSMCKVFWSVGTPEPRIVLAKLDPVGDLIVDND